MPPRNGVGEGGGSVAGRAVEVSVGVLKRSAMFGVGERFSTTGVLTTLFASAMNTSAPNPAATKPTISARVPRSPATSFSSE